MQYNVMLNDGYLRLKNEWVVFLVKGAIELRGN